MNPHSLPTLPIEVQLKIVNKLNVIEKVVTASAVSYEWFNQLKDPNEWLILDMTKYPPTMNNSDLAEICMYAIGKSNGQLQELAPNLKVLHLHNCHEVSIRVMGTVIQRFTNLEELDIDVFFMSAETVELIGQSCSSLKSLNINVRNLNPYIGFNDHAIAIGKTMGELQRLTMATPHKLTNIGIEVVLDGCPAIRHLNVVNCENLKLTHRIRDRCIDEFIHVEWPEGFFDDNDDPWSIFLDVADDFRHY